MSLAGAMMLDPRAFLGDEDVRMMTEREAWCYIRLLFHQWEEGSIPNDARRLAAILTEGPRVVTAEDLVGLEAPLEGTLEAPLPWGLWVALKPCFREVDEDPTRLQHDRVAVERSAWIAKHDKFVSDGKKGQAARRKALKAKKKDGSSHPEATLEPPSRPGSSDPSSEAAPFLSPSLPFPVHSNSKKKAEDKDRPAAPLPAFLLGLHFPDGVNFTSSLALEKLVERDTADPKAHRAKLSDPPALAEEWIHHVAWWIPRMPKTDDGESFVELWSDWRTAKPPKGKKKPYNTTKSEVVALRLLLKHHEADPLKARDLVELARGSYWVGLSNYLANGDHETDGRTKARRGQGPGFYDSSASNATEKFRRPDGTMEDI